MDGKTHLPKVVGSVEVDGSAAFAVKAPVISTAEKTNALVMTRRDEAIFMVQPPKQRVQIGYDPL